MEKVAYELSKNLAKITDVKLVKWGGSNKWLPLVLPYLLFHSLWILLSRKVSVIYLEDGLLAPLGLILKLFTKPVVITIHGKDITYKNKLYQLLFPRLIAKLDKVICVSEATAWECRRRGIPQSNITVIPNGISDEFYINDDKTQLKERLAKELKIKLNNKKVLLSVGRLVERKGIHWFIEHVMPKIAEKRNDCIHLVVGDGNFSSQVQEARRQSGLKDSIHLLNKVDDKTLKLLYNASDIFIMPNIPVKGDMEGFGLVALEASSCALPVVASDLEGIKNAIQDGKNGLLVEPGNAQSFAEKVTKLLGSDEWRENFGAQARDFTLEHYGWAMVTRLYLEVFRAL